MVQNYLLAVWRNFRRHRLFTAINIAGLSIGITACLLIAQYAVYELSYDQFWKDPDQVYRVHLDRYDKGALSTRWAAGCLGIGPDLKANFPEVDSYVRLTESTALLAHGDTYFSELSVFYASEDFFRVFGYPLMDGSDSAALRGPNRMVISKSLSKKYFGDENPIGKTLRNRGRTDYLITGVFEDFPEHAHLKIDALLSFATYARLMGRTDESALTEWQWDGFLTYVRLRPNTDVHQLESKLPPFVVSKVGEELKQYNAGMKFYFMPVTNIHLDSNFIGELRPNGDRETVYFLSVVAVLVLLIAWINYINLATARSVERAREVGVRKVMGSMRQQLVHQFLIESVVMNGVAVILAAGLFILATPWFADFVGRDMGGFLFQRPGFWLAALGVLLAGAALSGLYPAFVLSGYRPAEVLKGKFRNSSQGTRFRKTMVVVQFSASLILVIGTFTVYRQLSFMRAQDLGLNIDQTVIINSPLVVDSTYQSRFAVLKNRYQQLPDVSSVSASSMVPGQGGDNAGGIRRLNQTDEEQNQYRFLFVDADYVPSYEIELVAGRSFSANTSGEERSALVNESGMRLLGFQKPEEALQELIFFWGDTLRIVGVLKNFHQESVKKAYDPLIVRYAPAPQGAYSVKISAAHVQESVRQLEEVWKEVFPGNPFNYHFLDEFFNRQYEADQQFGKVFTLFSLLATFIACLGLFGLASLMVIQRTKEIGVRKVLGASVPGILMLMSKDYLFLLSASIVVATPLAWWVMHGWLEGFATRIPLSWTLFALPCLLVIVVALATAGLHTLRAAHADPVRALRYE